MIWLIIALVGTLILIPSMAWKLYSDTYGGEFLDLVMGGVAGACISAFVFLLAIFIGGNLLFSLWVGDHAVPDFKVGLQAISAGSQTRGSFFLGSGYIDDEQVYYYFSKNGNRYHLSHVGADGTDVVEDAKPETSYMQCWKYKSNHESLILSGFVGSKYACEAHVPPGSVVQNFNVKTPGS